MLHIDIENFRCYQHFSVGFKPGINLLIGDNASGKTSLLMACKYALSAFFVGFSDENTKLESPGADDFRVIPANEDTLVDELPIRITFTQDDLFENAYGTYTVCKKSKKNSRALVSGLTDYKNAAKNLQDSYYSNANGQTTFQKALPLFVSFSTEDIHTVRKIKGEQFASYRQKPSFGYYECLNCNGLLKYWKRRLLVLVEAEKNLTEIEIVKDSIRKALGEEGCGIINDMMVRPNKKKVFYRFVDGRECELDLLSDGYKRLVNIVTDIAFRCALLNKNLYGSEAAQRTKGTVLIDEIDMHLHPMLQAKVMKGLRHAFPNLQFIVTTHAPMVMTGVMTNGINAVCRISYHGQEYTIEPVNTYGLDASKILRVILGMAPRDSVVENRLNELFDNIDNNRSEEAARQLQTLENEFGDSLPELVQARTMLEFNVINDD